MYKDRGKLSLSLTNLKFEVWQITSFHCLSFPIPTTHFAISL